MWLVVARVARVAVRTCMRAEVALQQPNPRESLAAKRALANARVGLQMHGKCRKWRVRFIAIGAQTCGQRSLVHHLVSRQIGCWAVTTTAIAADTSFGPLGSCFSQLTKVVQVLVGAHRIWNKQLKRCVSVLWMRERVVVAWACCGCVSAPWMRECAVVGWAEVRVR